MLQPLEKLFELDRLARMFHENIQDDKRPALLAVAGLMDAAGAQYVVSGGLATQLHVSNPRFTADIDRADLIELLQDNPGLYDRLRAVAEERLQPLLEAVYAESTVTVEPYPDFDDQTDAEP